ncbi:MAG: ArnT family glycosyltransferase [Elusimicrobiota bacterium]
MSSFNRSLFDVSTKIGVASVLVLTFFLCLNYFFSFPVYEFVLKIQSLFISSSVFILCYFLGRISGKFIGEPNYHSTLLKVITRFAVGIGSLGFLVIVLGWAFPGSLLAKIFLIFIFLLLISVHQLREFFHEKKFILIRNQLFEGINKQNRSLSEFILLSISFLGMLVSFIACFSPVTYYDSLVYHLALPQTYLKWGKVATVPFNMYSYFPANMEMIFLFVMGLIKNPDYAINLVGWGVSVLCSLLLFDFVKEKASFKIALFGYLLWWTAPVVLFLSIGAYVDIPLSFFTLLAIRFFSFYLSERNSKSLFFSGFFAGICISIKYTGAIAAIIFSVFLLIELIRKRESIKAIFIFWIVVIFPVLPWLIKNFLACGNPVFPFFYKFLGHPQSWEPESAQKYFSILTEYGIKNNFLSDLFVFSWNVSTNPKIFGGGIDVLGLFGWPLLFIFTLLGGFFILRDKFFNLSLGENKDYLLVLYLIAHFLFWFYSKPVLRFLVPLLPLFIVIGCMGINSLKIQSRKAFVGFVSFPWLIGNFFIFFFISQQLRPFSVALGLETVSEYLTKRFEYYPAFQYINFNSDHIDRVILVGEQRSYGLSANVSTLNLTATSPLARLCNESKDIYAVLSDLFNSGSFYILISKKELERLGGLGQLGFTSDGISRFNLMIEKFYDPIFNYGSVTLYKQKPPLKIESN